MSESKPAQKKNRKSILTILIPLLVGAGVGVAAALLLERMAGDDMGLYFFYLAMFMVGIFAAYLIQIIIHEAGHMVFGLMTGYRFVSFNVLGFIWQKGPDGKLRVGRMQIAGAGGQCLMAPPEYAGGSYPFTLYNLGGVLTNLIASALCALLAWVCPFDAVDILLILTSAVGVFFAALNGLPIPVAAIQNDGRNLLCIRRDMDARRAFWVQMAIAAELARGTRIKSMPEAWFEPFPEEKMDNPIISAMAVMNVSRLIDKMDFSAAEHEIRRLLAREKGVLDLYRMTMTCDGAMCELLAGRPADLTAGLETPQIQQLMKAMKSYPSILRTQYAVALLKERDGDKAQKLLDEFEAAARRHPNPQEIIGERELLLAIQNALLGGGTNP